YFYLFGIGVEKDEKQAFELYQKAAKQNCAPALKTLAFMYMQGLGTEQDIPKGFDTLVQAFRVMPDNNLEDVIWRIETNENYKKYSLKAKIEDYKKSRRQKFLITDSSDEDYIAEKFKFFNNIYRLYFRNGIGSMYSWQRPTWSIVLGETVGEITPLKEQYLIKDSIQGYYQTMTYLSYYYKGEAQDIAKAQLWRKYAITMGELPFENYWPGYPPLEE
ncbi:hypothetical protein GQ597_11925, partial [Gilliamella sp. Pra-s65]|uniref:tetratricopeptide repeat protein n=1 Tax=unclassified Gilliamella TaxID=2685620 RepID=UPI00136559E8